MPISALAIFASVLSSFRGHFTASTFVRFVILAVGWILTCDPSAGGCVTEALIAARVSGSMHWAAFHRFFSRAVWDPDAMGRTLFRLVEPLLSVIRLVIDDTLAHKRGGCVFGASTHIDPVTSTARWKNLVRGHCWVVFGLVLPVPWSKRGWFIPLMFRLYRGKKEAGAEYRTKSELGREMLDLFLTWVDPTRRVLLLIDSGYMGKTMLDDLPFERVTVVGSLKTNAALHRPPSRNQGKSKRRGRRRKKGERLPTPAKMHNNKRLAWKKITTDGPKKAREKEVLSLKALWFSVLGERVNHVVLIREDEKKLRVVLCTDEALSAKEIVEQGALRWPIEVWNRDAKQFFDFADSPAWSKLSVLRTAPWVALLSGILVVWFHRVYTEGMKVPQPERPWYVQKEDVSFADIVRAAQETLRTVDALDFAVGILGRELKTFKKAANAKNTIEHRDPKVQKMAQAA